MPVFTNLATGEPYIRLPAPLDSIIVTPPRGPNIPSDEAAVVAALNDPNVYANLAGAPLPYESRHAVEYQTSQQKECQELLAEWDRITQSRSQSQSHASSDNGGSDSDSNESDGSNAAAAAAAQLKQQYVRGCPFRSIREVTQWSPDGHPVRDVLIGDNMFYEYRFNELPSGEEREKAHDALKKLPAGSEEMIWEVGCMYNLFYPLPFFCIPFYFSFLYFLSISF